MTQVQENRKTSARPATIGSETIAGFLRDAIGSLNAPQAATKILARLPGITVEQALVAALDLLCEQADDHADEIDEISRDRGRLEDVLTDCEIAIMALRAQLTDRKGAMS